MFRSFMALVSLTLVASSGFAAETSHRPCQVRNTMFEGWPAQVISNEWLEIVIVKQLGGRLMQVTFAGHTYLFVNPKYKGKYISPEQANGQWINYGGDKLWPLPEGLGDEQHWPGPVSDPLDDGAYDLTVISQAPVCSVRLDGPADPASRLQYSREITVRTDSPEISFHAVMKNAGAKPIRWSVQSVTQFDTSDVHNPAQYNRDFWAFTPVNPQSAYLTGYQVRNGLADDPSFAVSDGLFKLHWAYLENEVWLDSTAGWVAVVDSASQFALVERFQYLKDADYPGKASVIFYKNGAALGLNESGLPVLRSNDVESAPYYMEAEINSPMVELRPEESYAMDTHWFPTRADNRLRGATSAGVILAPFSAALSGNSLALAGSFGVFFPGKLQARLLDGQGEEQERIDLDSVGPQTRVELRREIKMRQITVRRQPVRASIHLVDDQGIDRGSLGETAILSAKP